MRVICWSFLTIVIIFVSGCTAAGGGLSGMYPQPLKLKGDINDNIYTAEDQSFSVTIPHEAGSYERSYMKANDEKKGDVIYVSFGPFAFDQTVYRIEVVKGAMGLGISQNFDDFCHASHSIRAYRESGGKEPEVIDSARSTIDGNESCFHQVRVTIPGDNSGVYTFNDAGELVGQDTSALIHEYRINFKDRGIAVVSVQRTETSGHEGMDSITFAQSLKMH